MNIFFFRAAFTPAVFRRLRLFFFFKFNFFIIYFHKTIFNIIFFKFITILDLDPNPNSMYLVPQILSFPVTKSEQSLFSCE